MFLVELKTWNHVKSEWIKTWVVLEQGRRGFVKCCRCIQICTWSRLDQLVIQWPQKSSPNKQEFTKPARTPFRCFFVWPSQAWKDDWLANLQVAIFFWLKHTVFKRCSGGTLSQVLVHEFSSQYSQAGLCTMITGIQGGNLIDPIARLEKRSASIQRG